MMKDKNELDGRTKRKWNEWKAAKKAVAVDNEVDKNGASDSKNGGGEMVKIAEARRRR